MKVNVYGKEGCALCDAAKKKLQMMEIFFGVFDIAKTVQYHEGWREDESVEVTACYNDIDTLPVITVDGKAMSYPAAMKLLKSAQKPVAEPVVVNFERVLAQPAAAEQLVAVG